MKTYVTKDSFLPRLTSPSADRYLLQLLGWQRGILQNPDVATQEVAPFDELPIPRRVINTGVLRAVTQAITGKQQLEINYQSMSRPKPTLRHISPHSLAFDRLRWHVRAYCDERNTFRDFVLTRIFSTHGSRPTSIDPRQDIAWNTYVNVRIAPHPELTTDQRRALEIDYGMTDSRAELRVRAAMLFYLLRVMHWIGANDQSPIEQQIVIVNRAEVEKQINLHTPEFANVASSVGGA